MARTRNIPDDVRQQAYLLRNGGHSLRAISTALALPKSTLQYILAGIRLTSTGAARVRSMQARAVRAASERLEHARPRARRAQQSEEARARAAARARELSLQYQPHELAMRARLQPLYGEDMTKEAFDGVVIKACTLTHVVDWAKNKATVYKLPKRFAVVKSLCDKRRRVAYIPERYLESPAARRLRKLRVVVLSLDALVSPDTEVPCAP